MSGQIAERVALDEATGRFIAYGRDGRPLLGADGRPLLFYNPSKAMEALKAVASVRRMIPRRTPRPE